MQQMPQILSQADQRTMLPNGVLKIFLAATLFGCACTSNEAGQRGITVGSPGTVIGSGSTGASASVADSQASLAPVTPAGGGVTLNDLTSLDESTAKVIFGAIEELKSRCMIGHGLPYRKSVFVAVESDSASASNAALQAHYGYSWRLHTPWRVAASDAPKLAPAVQKALDETCGPMAAEEIRYSEYLTPRQILADASSDIFQRVLTDPRYLAVVERWSDCMKNAGYQFADLSEPRLAAPEMEGGAEGPKAVELAQADFGCESAVDLPKVRRNVEIELSTVWIEAHPQSVVDLRTQDAAIVERAKAIVGS